MVFVNFVCFMVLLWLFCVLYGFFCCGFCDFFTALVLCSCGCVSFFDLFCGLCLCPCGVCAFSVCICVMNCGSPVGADL